MGIQEASDAIEMNEVRWGWGACHVRRSRRYSGALVFPGQSRGGDRTKGALGSMVRPMEGEAAMHGLWETKKED